MTPLRPVWSAPFFLLLFACAGPQLSPTTDHIPRLAPERSLVLASPKELKEDYAYPPAKMRQTLRWAENDEFEWHIQFAPQNYSYGGVVFRHPKRLGLDWDQKELVFSVQPGSAAPLISVGFVDGDAVAPRVFIDRPLDVPEGDAAKKIAIIRIPLTAFGREGISVSNDMAYAPFDWNDVREIRFIANRAPPGREVVIRKLLFEK